jgi:hypothetical protein
VDNHKGSLYLKLKEKEKEKEKEKKILKYNIQVQVQVQVQVSPHSLIIFMKILQLFNEKIALEEELILIISVNFYNSNTLFS